MELPNCTNGHKIDLDGRNGSWPLGSQVQTQNFIYTAWAIQVHNAKQYCLQDQQACLGCV